MSRQRREVRNKTGNRQSPVALVALLSCGLVLPAVGASVPDNWNVEGEHGELQVFGTMTESACRLDMTSAWQAVDLGNIALPELAQVGDQGTPVAVVLKLRDCIRGPAEGLDRRTGTRTWDAIQPVVSVTFLATTDPDNPQLVKAAGVSGLGLRIKDSQHRDIRLGERNVPQLVNVGDDELVYWVIPERTASSLQPGSYRVVVNLVLDYS